MTDKPTDADYQELSKRDVKIKGRVYHLLKTVEECSELSKAITQHITKGDPVTPILEEVGDMELCLRNLRNIYGDKRIDKLKAEKYEHRDEKLDKKEEEGVKAPDIDKAIDKLSQ
jgi:hypothetical protein